VSFLIAEVRQAASSYIDELEDYFGRDDERFYQQY
jgi:hypothetical protein